MTRSTHPPPPLFVQRCTPFVGMWYWLHRTPCPLLYRAHRVALPYRT